MPLRATEQDLFFSKFPTSTLTPACIAGKVSSAAQATSLFIWESIPPGGVFLFTFSTVHKHFFYCTCKFAVYALWIFQCQLMSFWKLAVRALLSHVPSQVLLVWNVLPHNCCLISRGGGFSGAWNFSQLKVVNKILFHGFPCTFLFSSFSCARNFSFPYG